MNLHWPRRRVETDVLNRTEFIITGFYWKIKWYWNYILISSKKDLLRDNKMNNKIANEVQSKQSVACGT